MGEQTGGPYIELIKVGTIILPSQNGSASSTVG